MANSFDPTAQLAKLNGSYLGVRYEAEQYEYEKIIGKRTQTGALKLKKLTPKHRIIIGYHVRCLSNADISLITGYNEAYISTLLRDPLSQAYIKEIRAGIDEELEALGPLAVDAVRQGLQSQSEKTRLQAADKFFRATNKYGDSGGGGKETAEDVIARALDAIQAQAGAINNLARPERPRAIDVQFSEVTHGDNTDSEHETVKRLPPVDLVESE